MEEREASHAYLNLIPIQKLRRNVFSVQHKSGWMEMIYLAELFLLSTSTSMIIKTE
jgi:hypothetical protein